MGHNTADVVDGERLGKDCRCVAERRYQSCAACIWAALTETPGTASLAKQHTRRAAQAQAGGGAHGEGHF